MWYCMRMESHGWTIDTKTRFEKKKQLENDQLNASWEDFIA